MLSLISIRERVFIETSLVTWLLLGSAKLGGAQANGERERQRDGGKRCEKIGERDGRKLVKFSPHYPERKG